MLINSVSQLLSLGQKGVERILVGCRRVPADELLCHVYCVWKPETKNYPYNVNYFEFSFQFSDRHKICFIK